MVRGTEPEELIVVQPKEPPRSIRLPRETEDKLREELSATGRSASSIITEALAIRRAALEVLGMEAGGVESEVLPDLVAECVRAGLRARSGR